MSTNPYDLEIAKAAREHGPLACALCGAHAADYNNNPGFVSNHACWADGCPMNAVLLPLHAWNALNAAILALSLAKEATK